MDKDVLKKYIALDSSMASDVMMVGPKQYAEIIRLTKPSVYLLHGYYPGGRNNP